jgi:hypothetical protein
VIRFTHDAQVIPSTGKEMISIGVVVLVIGSGLLAALEYSQGVSSHAGPPSVE